MLIKSDMNSLLSAFYSTSSKHSGLGCSCCSQDKLNKLRYFEEKQIERVKSTSGNKNAIEYGLFWDKKDYLVTFRAWP